MKSYLAFRAYEYNAILPKGNLLHFPIKYRTLIFLTQLLFSGF